MIDQSIIELEIEDTPIQAQQDKSKTTIKITKGTIITPSEAKNPVLKAVPEEVVIG